MSNPFDKIKARLDNNTSTGSTSGVGSNSGYNQRLSQITKKYDDMSSIFTSVYGDAKASAEAEVKAVNDKLKKQQRTQAILGTLTALASFAPQAMSFLSSIKACKAAAVDTKATPQQKQTQLQQYTQELQDAEAKVKTAEADIKKLDDEIKQAEEMKKDPAKYANEKQKTVDTKRDELKALQGLNDDTDETLKTIATDLKTQNETKTTGEKELTTAKADLAKAEALPEKVQKQTGTDATGKPVYTQVENTARKTAIETAQKKVEAAEKKVKDAEEAIKNLETKKSERKAEIEKQIAAKKEELDNAIKENEQVQSDIKNADETITAKTKEKNEKIAEKTKLESEVVQFRTAVEDLKKSIDSTKTQTAEQKQQKEDPTKKKQA